MGKLFGNNEVIVIHGAVPPGAERALADNMGALKAGKAVGMDGTVISQKELRDKIWAERGVPTKPKAQRGRTPEQQLSMAHATRPAASYGFILLAFGIPAVAIWAVITIVVKLNGPVIAEQWRIIVGG